MLRINLALLLMAASTLASCSSSRDLVSPNARPILSKPTLERADAQEQQVTGQATIVLDNFNNALEKYTQSAIRHADGTFSGEFELKSEQATGLRVHGDVVCFKVIGNTAYLAGVIDQSDTEGAPPGSYVLWNIVDNGEGANSPPDLTSDFYVLPLDLVTLQCTEGIDLGAFPVVNGNLQVH